MGARTVLSVRSASKTEMTARNMIALISQTVISKVNIDRFLISPYNRGMRTTLIIDDDILKKASELTGVDEKAALVRMGLESLIARRSARRLASLGGTDSRAKAAPRRRPKR